MFLSDEDRSRCDACLQRLSQTKMLCMQSIQYLVEQQREIDECIEDLKSTKWTAQVINARISELNDISWLELCCSKSKPFVLSETNHREENNLLILPFAHSPADVNGLTALEENVELEKLFQSINHSLPSFTTKDEFEEILQKEYTSMFELAKKLTKCIQILHDTIEYLGTDVKFTLEHMQSAQPRMRHLLQVKAPSAFAQVQNDLLL